MKRIDRLDLREKVVNMGASQITRDIPVDSHEGACSHCGWNQPLQKVTRRQLALMRSASYRPPVFGFRWLCEECIADLTGVGAAWSAPSVPSATPVRHYSVA